MSLTVYLAVQDHVDPTELFVQVRELVRTPDGIVPDISPGVLSNPPAVGASAWLHVRYGQAMQRYFEDHDLPAGTCLVVSLDIAYAPPGEFPAEQTAAGIIAGLGWWLGELGVSWSWYDEQLDSWSSQWSGLATFGMESA